MSKSRQILNQVCEIDDNQLLQLCKSHEREIRNFALDVLSERQNNQSTNYCFAFFIGKVKDIIPQIVDMASYDVVRFVIGNYDNSIMDYLKSIFDWARSQLEG